MRKLIWSVFSIVLVLALFNLLVMPLAAELPANCEAAALKCLLAYTFIMGPVAAIAACALGYSFCLSFLQ